MSTNETRSATIGALAAALAKAQGALPHAIKDSANPYFKSKYADLAAVWDACRGPLSTNELAVIQSVLDDPANRVVVETVLMHSSGEWMSSRISMAPKDDTPQAVGSAITYARRYGLQAMVGIAPDDDDGNAASGRDKPERVVVAPRPKSTPQLTSTTASGTLGTAPMPYVTLDYRLNSPIPPAPAEDMSAKIQASIDAMKKETPVEYITPADKAKINMKFREALREDKQPLAEQFLHDYLRTVGILDPFGTPSVSFIPKSRFAEIGKGAVKFAADLE